MSKTPVVNSTKYPEPVKTACFESYLSNELTLEQIAEKFKVPFRTMISWHQKEKWAKQKNAIQQQIRDTFEEKYVKLVMKHRDQVAERQLEKSELIENTIGDIIKDAINKDGKTKLKSRDIQELAKALASSASVSQRIVQLDVKSGGGSSNSPVHVDQAFIQYNLKPHKKSKDDLVIDVTADAFEDPDEDWS